MNVVRRLSVRWWTPFSDAVDGGEHLAGEPGGFLTHGGHALTDESVEVGLQAAGRILGDAAAVVGHFELRHAFGHFQPDAVGGRDLEQAGLEGETLGDVPGGRERLFDGGDQVFGAAVHVAGGLAPFDHRVFTQRRVAGDEVERGFAEFVAEFVELVGEIAEARIGNEAADASQEREAGAFDGGLHPGFDQGEGLRARRAGSGVCDRAG